MAQETNAKFTELPKAAVVQYSDNKYDVFKNVKKKLKTKYIRLIEHDKYDFEAYFPNGWFPGRFIAAAGNYN